MPDQVPLIIQKPDGSATAPQSDASGNLKTTLAASDLQLGAVELKDATSEARAVIKSGAADDADNAVVVVAKTIPSIGSTNDSAASTDTGSFSVLSLIKRGLQNWTALLAKLPALSSGRIPVDASGVTQPVSAASLPLPSGAATEATLSAANAKLPALSSGRIPTIDASYDPIFGKQLVGTARDKFRDGFFSFDTANNWELVQTGSGQTISVAGAANGSRYLNIATGTTSSSETIILSRSSFQFPCKLSVALSMSQRIANQEVFLELVSVDANGAVETDATFPSTNLNNATNAVSFKFDAVTATSAMYLTRGYGISELASASTALVATTVATGTNPNFIPAGIWEINADMEESVFQTRAIDSLAAVSAAFKRTQNIPDPSKSYKIRIRVRNTGTPPASTTDVRIHLVRLLDTTRFTVDFARHMGRTTDIGDSVPVAISNAPSVSVSNVAAITAGANAIGDVGVQYRANATGAGTIAKVLALASTNPTVVKNGAGRLVGASLSNTTASWRYVKLHNIGTAPTAGSTAIAGIIPIAPNGSVTYDFPGGVGFTTGISYTIVTGYADADANAVAAGDVVGFLVYA